MLSVEDINLILQFMSRVNLNGNEAHAFVEIVEKLKQEAPDMSPSVNLQDTNDS